jgi:hypothetical protein
MSRRRSASVAVSFDAAFPTQPHVIPAKAGIHSLTNRLPELYEVDSRFRGNDVRSGAPESCK